MHLGATATPKGRPQTVAQTPTDLEASHRAVQLWLVGTTVIALVVLVLGLMVGGGAPTATPGGLPDAGPVTGWGLPVASLLTDLAGFATVGLTLVGSRLMTVGSAVLDHTRSAASRVAASWAALAVVQAVLHVSDLHASTVLTLEPDVWQQLAEGLRQSPEARALLVEAALAASVIWFVALGSGVSVRTIALVIALAAFLPKSLLGHAATDGRLINVAALVLHVAAAAIWIGGLAALAWLAVRRADSRALLAKVVPRYSEIALGCVVAIVGSGATMAAVRLGTVGALFQTGYGQIMLAKTAALMVLVGCGWLHRRHTVQQLRSAALARRRPPAGLPASLGIFLSLASIELVTMAATAALAVGLARTPPPV